VRTRIPLATDPRPAVFLCALLAAAWIGVAAAPGLAHDLTIEPEGDGLVLRYGHEAGGGHGEVAIPPDFVLAAVCFGADGAAEPLALDGSWPVRFPAGCAAAWALVSSGYWTKTPAGTRNLPATEVENALSSRRSFESVKRLDAWSDALARPLTDELEIVPAVDPRNVAPGRKLDLRVFRARRPAPGLPVSCNGQVRGQTGEDGAIRLKIPGPGTVLIQATWRGPHDGPQAQETVVTAGLQFESRGSK
jgi:nickel transport protein